MNPQEVGTRLVALLSTAPTLAEGGQGGSVAPTLAEGGQGGSVAPTLAEGGLDRPVSAGDESDHGRPVAEASVSGGQRYARATVDVPVAAWPEAARLARDDAELAFDFFDWLSAVDELTDPFGTGKGNRAAAAGDSGDAPAEGPFDGFTVVVHLWSTAKRHGLLLRTRVPRDAPAVPSIVHVYPGAAWHERETHEMFGVDFPGHPGELEPLLLSSEFEGHPLRKEFVLASRVVKDWPGAKEPGESESGAKRTKMRPPGVPDPGEWGPGAARGADASTADPGGSGAAKESDA